MKHFFAMLIFSCTFLLLSLSHFPRAERVIIYYTWTLVLLLYCKEHKISSSNKFKQKATQLAHIPSHRIPRSYLKQNFWRFINETPCETKSERKLNHTVKRGNFLLASLTTLSDTFRWRVLYLRASLWHPHCCYFDSMWIFGCCLLVERINCTFL